jgi:hypothetical protein
MGFFSEGFFYGWTLSLTLVAAVGWVWVTRLEREVRNYTDQASLAWERALSVGVVFLESVPGRILATVVDFRQGSFQVALLPEARAVEDLKRKFPNRVLLPSMVTLVMPSARYVTQFLALGHLKLTSQGGPKQVSWSAADATSLVASLRMQEELFDRRN